MPPLEKIYECESLFYDKIRWPSYKDMVFKRSKNLPYLPMNPRVVSKMVGLRNAADWTAPEGSGEAVAAKGLTGPYHDEPLNEPAVEAQQ